MESRNTIKTLQPYTLGQVIGCADYTGYRYIAGIDKVKVQRRGGDYWIEIHTDRKTDKLFPISALRVLMGEEKLIEEMSDVPVYLHSFRIFGPEEIEGLTPVKYVMDKWDQQKSDTLRPIHQHSDVCYFSDHNDLVGDSIEPEPVLIKDIIHVRTAMVITV